MLSLYRPDDAPVLLLDSECEFALGEKRLDLPRDLVILLRVIAMRSACFGSFKNFKGMLAPSFPRSFYHGLNDASNELPKSFPYFQWPLKT